MTISNGGKRKLSLREAAVIKQCWILTTEERDRLDKFFRVLDTWQNVEHDFTVDDVELRRFLQHEGFEYEVVLLSPVRVLRTAKEVGMSFRVNIASGMRIVLIKEWKEEAAKNG